MPLNTLIDKYGKRKCLIIGNIFVSLSILALIFADNIYIIIFSNFLSAFGYNLKALTESTLLYDSIPRSDKRNDIYSEIDGKGASYYYYLDAISSIATGFLFVINGYLPILLCLLFCILATYLSSKFKNIPGKTTPKSSLKKHYFKESMTDLKQAFDFIFRSNRLRSLILFHAILASLFSLIGSTLRSSLLTDINLPAQYFGIIAAAIQIISGIASQNSNYFHNKYKNRALTFLGLGTTLSMILISIPVIYNFNFGISLEFILIILAFMAILKGPFYTLIKRYLNSFAKSDIRVKISTANDLVYSIFKTITSILASMLIAITSTSYVFVILGCIFTLVFLALLQYMKDKVGLKPEEYDKKEIEFTVLK